MKIVFNVMYDYFVLFLVYKLQLAVCFTVGVDSVVNSIQIWFDF